MNKNLTYRRNTGYSSHEQDKDTTGKKKKNREVPSSPSPLIQYMVTSESQYGVGDRQRESLLFLD